MKKTVFCFLFILVLSQIVLAAGVNPTQVRVIEEFINEHMNRFSVPGMSIVIVSGQDVYTSGFGVLTAGSGQLVNDETNFGVASVSKSFTTMAIMQLHEQGLLNIHDPVVKYLPWFGTKDTENSKLITIRDLMQHTSGIPTTAYGLEIKRGTEDDLEEQIRRLSRISLTARPGQRFQYSNMNYWTQALLVEKLTGLKFADYVEQAIFTPMEMNRSGFYNTVISMGNLATGHRIERGKSKPFDYSVPYPTNAAGGVYTNAADMGNYIQTILNGGTFNEHILVNSSSLEQMISTRDPRLFYGYGWMVRDWNGKKVVEHGGDNPNYTAHVYLLPEQNLGFAILSNSQHSVTHGIARNIANFLFMGQPMQPIRGTAVENTAQLVKLITFASYGLILIAILWLTYIIRGLKRGTHVAFKVRPGIVRLIFQAILVPLIGIVVGIIGFQIPIKFIGSYHIALLYEGDLVKSVLGLLSVVVLFSLMVGFLAFVKKANKIDKTL